MKPCFVIAFTMAVTLGLMSQAAFAQDQFDAKFDDIKMPEKITPAGSCEKDKKKDFPFDDIIEVTTTIVNPQRGKQYILVASAQWVEEEIKEGKKGQVSKTNTNNNDHVVSGAGEKNKT